MTCGPNGPATVSDRSWPNERERSLPVRGDRSFGPFDLLLRGWNGLACNGTIDRAKRKVGAASRLGAHLAEAVE